MATEPEGTDPQLDTKGIIAERLGLVGADAKCPICGHVSWGVPSATFALIPIENGHILTDRGAAVRAVVCNNCGFIRLHAIDTLIC